MKQFIFKVENTTKNPSRYGGRKQKAIVYRVKNNKPEYLGETRTWSTASYRGAIGEVNEWLVENKHIPKSWSTHDGVYTPYFPYMNGKYDITEI